MAKQPVDSINRRIRTAVGVSVAIFAVTLGYWGVLTNQQSQADTVGATTLTFDDHSQGSIPGDTYAAQGVYIDSPNAGGGGYLHVPDATGFCAGYQPPSSPNVLTVNPGPSFGPWPLVVGFTNNQVSDSVSLVVLNSLVGVSVKSYDASNALIEEKGIGASNTCVNTPVTLSKGSSTGIARIEVYRHQENAAYGYGIDNVSFGPLHAPISNFDFTLTPTSGNAPLTVTATYTGTQVPGLTLNWDFGDGQTSQNGPTTVSHTYSATGTYQLKLTSGSFSAQKTVTVSATPAPPRPALSFSVTPATGVAPLTVTGTGPTVAAGRTITWAWGDSSAPQQQTGASIAHIYAQAGTFMVAVTQTDTVNGQTTTQTAQKSVVVSPDTTQDASLTMSKSVYLPGESVSFVFKNLGTDALTLPDSAPFTVSNAAGSVFSPIASQVVDNLPGGAAKSWAWDQKATAGSQVADGAYTVTVRYLHGTEPKTRSASFTIAKAATPPTFTFSFNPTSGTAPLTVAASLSGAGTDAASAIWDFGDGGTVTGATASHTYTSAGTFTATVRIGSQVGTQSVVVRQAAATTVTTSTAPVSRLAQTGTSLGLALLLSFVLAGVASYLIIRRPFHG